MSGQSVLSQAVSAVRATKAVDALFYTSINGSFSETARTLLFAIYAQQMPLQKAVNRITDIALTAHNDDSAVNRLIALRRIAVAGFVRPVYAELLSAAVLKSSRKENVPYLKAMAKSVVAGWKSASINVTGLAQLDADKQEWQRIETEIKQNAGADGTMQPGRRAAVVSLAAYITKKRDKAPNHER